MGRGEVPGLFVINARCVLHMVLQGSLKDMFCPFKTWLSPLKQRDTVYKAMFRCLP